MDEIAVVDQEQVTPVYINKSNYLISAKFKASLMENQLITIAMSRLILKQGMPYAKMTAVEVGKLTKRSKNVYRDMKVAVLALPHHTLIIADDKPLKGKAGKLKAMAFITNAEYDNGLLEIYFNKDLIPHMMDLKNNFTALERSVLLKFKKDYSFRIYELFRKEIFRIKPPNKSISVEYELNEFKATIGIINLNNEYVRAEIERRPNDIDFNRIANKPEVENQFSNWYDFKRRVLEPARKEIDKISDISFSYETIAKGLGGKISRIIFYISRNARGGMDAGKIRSDASAVLESAEIMELVLYMKAAAVTVDQAKDLLKTASYSMETVKKIYDAAMAKPEIRNLMGWMKERILHGLDVNIPIVEGSRETGENLKEVRNILDENKEKIAQNVWNRIKQRPEYPKFMEYIGMDEEIYELLSAEERTQGYVDWKKGVAAIK